MSPPCLHSEGCQFDATFLNISCLVLLASLVVVALQAEVVYEGKLAILMSPPCLHSEGCQFDATLLNISCLVLLASLVALQAEVVCEGKLAILMSPPCLHSEGCQFDATLLSIFSLALLVPSLAALQAEVVCGPPELDFEACLVGPDVLPVVVREWAGLEHVLCRLIAISTMTGYSVCLADPL